MGANRQVSRVEDQFVSSIFLVPKPDGSLRLILNLKQLKTFIISEHFKIEDEKTVRRLIRWGSFMATIDLKNAYYLVPIREADEKLLRFLFCGKLFEFQCLPFVYYEAGSIPPKIRGV